MPRKIALLVDADNWPQTTLYAILSDARRSGHVEALAFGNFGEPQLRIWEPHFRALGFRCCPPEPPRVADDDLAEQAKRLAREGHEIWVATKDRPLLQRLSLGLDGGSIFVIEDPEARRLPRGMAWRVVIPEHAPIRSDLLARLEAAFAAHLRNDGWAHFSDIAGTLRRDPPLVAQEHGREKLLDLYRDLWQTYLVEEMPGSTVVRVRRLPSDVSVPE